MRNRIDECIYFDYYFPINKKESRYAEDSAIAC